VAKNNKKLQTALDALRSSKALVKQQRDAFDTLMIYVQYMQLDIEALQRENKYLRDMISELTNDDDDDPEPIG